MPTPDHERSPAEARLASFPPATRQRIEQRFEQRLDRPPGPRPLLFVVLSVVISFFVQVPAAVVALVTHRVEGPAGLALVGLALVGPLALAFARRFPGPVVAVITAAAVIDLLFTPGSGAPYIALAFAIISAMVRGARVVAVASVAAGWVLALTGSIALGVDWHPLRVVATTIGILAVLFIGEGIRTRAERLRQFQAAARARRDDAAQAERNRIARELHDVLAHSLSQINVQAGVGLHLIEAHPEKAAEALANIKQTSRIALDEVRGVLGFLRSEAGAPLVPEADLSRLPALVASMSSSFLAIELDDRLHTNPSPGVQLALYRIAQESLTNVVRHAGAHRATVLLDETESEYVLSVTDDGSARPAASALAGETAGRGLVGMRERAELLGGVFAAGPSVGIPGSTGFTVRATVPKRGSR